ncbi:MAG: hypothetical protein IT307_18270, partial [Chloroflexi bacterium]|nr:hypothetical protein [Chloroflexota bacterium]
MHETLERVADGPEAANGSQPGEPRGSASTNGAVGRSVVVELPVIPNLGRTVRMVGTVVNVDTNDLPHPKNQRGELGKALFNWYRNTVSKDPLTRISAPTGSADKRNYLTTPVGGAPKGEVNSRRVQVDDPAAMTRHIKRVARTMGADVVGVAPTHPAFLYAGKRYLQEGTAEDEHEGLGPEALARRFPFIITTTVAWDYRTLQAHRHFIGDASYHVSQMRSAMILKNLEGYVRELGYTALRGAVIPQTAGLAAGIGELGRNGMLISERFGARIHMTDPILTDLPLVPDRP